MIPEAEQLEQWFPENEVIDLLDLRATLMKLPPKEQAKQGRKELRQLWDNDEVTLIEKTHFIRTKQPGIVTQLRLNYAQKKFYKDVIVKCRRNKEPIRAVILKARQLGFSTFIQAWQYEQCDRDSHRASLTISFDDVSSRGLFEKAAFVHKHLWFPRTLRRANDEAIEFEDNGSFFHVRTAGNLSAGRSETYHHLHCSELPMWRDTGETLLSAQQCVPMKKETSVFCESTAKGAVGDFYDLWRECEAGNNEFVPFFAPWYWDPDYTLEFANDVQRNKFAGEMSLTERRLHDTHKLTLEQLHWRRWKIRNDLRGSEAKFRQEFPTTPEEAFLTTGTPVFDADGVQRLAEGARPPQWIGNAYLVK